jgi:hypothetical protein
VRCAFGKQNERAEEKLQQQPLARGAKIDRKRGKSLKLSLKDIKTFTRHIRLYKFIKNMIEHKFSFFSPSLSLSSSSGRRFFLCPLAAAAAAAIAYIEGSSSSIQTYKICVSMYMHSFICTAAAAAAKVNSAMLFFSLGNYSFSISHTAEEREDSSEEASEGSHMCVYSLPRYNVCIREKERRIALSDSGSSSSHTYTCIHHFSFAKIKREK